MKIVNIHRREINEPLEKVSQLFSTLATKDDKIWPYENWPAIRFHDGLHIGSKGGHGPIRYTIVSFIKNKEITFEFTKPEGFSGNHTLRLDEQRKDKTEVIHEIKMRTSTIKASFLWFTTVKWLHNALIEDAFDKLENYFYKGKKKTKYSAWVHFLRNMYQRKSFQKNDR